MPQAIVDPEELRRFARNLKQFNAEIEQRMGQLHTQLISLGNTWRDQEHEKFMTEFEATSKVVARFLEASQQHVPFLARKAEKIEQYLNQR